MREIKLFEFKELLVVAQRNALDDFRDNHPEEVFNESDADMMQDWLEEYVETEYKLKRVDISFNLSYSQGDGVAFTKDYDQEELMVLAKKFLSDEDYDKLIEYIEVTDIWGQIEIVGRHSHENSMRFTIENSNRVSRGRIIFKRILC